MFQRASYCRAYLQISKKYLHVDSQMLTRHLKQTPFLKLWKVVLNLFFKKTTWMFHYTFKGKQMFHEKFYQSTVVKIWNKLRWTQPVCLWVLQRSQTTVETVWQQPAYFWTKKNYSMDSLTIIQDISTFNACALTRTVCPCFNWSTQTAWSIMVLCVHNRWIMFNLLL